MDVDVPEYWSLRARRFERSAPHKAGVYIDFLPVAHSIWAFVQRRAVDRHVALGAGKRVLDLGCGTGRWLVELAHRGARAVGFDVAQGMREAAKSNTQGLNAEVVSDLDQVDDNSVDDVLSLNVLHAIPDERTIRETLTATAQKLKRGGRLTVIVETHSDAFVHGRSRDLWRALIEAQGFRLERTSAAEYSLLLSFYRQVVRRIRSLGAITEDQYTRSLDLYNRGGWALRLHELNVAALIALGLPLEWLVVGRGFVPPFTSILLMTFVRIGAFPERRPHLSGDPPRGLHR